MEAADVSSSQISYVEDQAGDSQEVIAKEGNDASPSYEDALVDDASYENWEGTPSGSAGGTDQPDEFLEDGVEMKGDEELGGSSSPKPVNAEAPSSGHEDAESPASASVVPTVEQSPSELQSEQENVTVQVSNENQDVAVGESTHSLKLDTVQSSETEKVRPRSDAQSGRSATSSRRVSKASSSIPTSPPPPPPRNVRSSPMSKQTAKRPSINIAPSSPTPPPQSQNSLVDAFVQSVGEAKLGVARKDFLRCVYPDDQPGPKPNTKSTGVQTKFGLGVIIEPDVLLSEIRPWGRHAATMPRKKVGQPIVTVLPPILKIK
ncbi:hypothetical protein M427DRAFT_35817 [Gonapodya prolifera JEL478]|uniref:Uncharacterized protein n=1 Tax=Gonapodya prolifera (strain JEL478) TaxID=1344416 RepID=A0A139A4X6_GONPJ|nr:hypothetical protein M427DRAFT_35817 [Gonapodya prolifera JEL478]|eukprot:KXS11443.1 hypothetical protein M427DRAFT_35817 [Gonapodya prolifera JEL478]